MQIKGINYRSESHSLSIDHWLIEEGQHWGVFATRAQTTQLLARLFLQNLPLANGEQLNGELMDIPLPVAAVSLALQQQLLEQELADDDTDFMDCIDYGSTVEELLAQQGISADEVEQLLAQTDLIILRNRGFRQLSTGETRRLMLARALALKPQLLVLDDPYAGMDIAHRQWLSELLQQLALSMQLVIITSREDELPACISHIALFDEQSLTQTMTAEQWHHHPITQQLSALSQQKGDQLVELIRQHQHEQGYPDPLVEMKQVKVEYTDGLIFDSLDWTIKTGQHWQVRGPNGCGKSTLLGLILGDHPQCYCNDISVLGMKRGSGETIWDIKKNIGVVSSALHLQYRVNCRAIEVLLSGFYDSIGLYTQPSTKEVQLAKAWLQALEMADYAKSSFKSLDYGQQRLLLIARSLIKRPAIVILDEPYQGLDYLNRKLVYRTLQRIAELNLSQLLYVTHHEEDSLPAINNYVDFYPYPQGGYQAVATFA